MENQSNQVVKTDNQFPILQKIAVSTLALGVASPVFAADDITMPEVSITGILSYIGILVAAVATVAAANLMIHLAAKGIKAIKTAF